MIKQNLCKIYITTQYYMFKTIKHIICFGLLFNNFHLADSFKGHFITRHNFIKNTLLMATNDNLHKIQYGNEEPDDKGQLTTLNKYNNNIYFVGVLDDETCFGINESLLKQKNRILEDEKIKEKHINLYLQSPGGALLPTLALVDSIKNFEVPVYTYIYGYVGSAATLLSVVGKKRFIYKHSTMMIHGIKFNSRFAVDSLVQVKDLNDNVDLFMDNIKDIYLSNSDLTSDILDEMFIHDKWFSSKTALEYGLVDEIL